MLSGGERALTAVALLLAMLEVRPVPFCVLDEVDAALDEANVGRFAQALRSLAEQTQFIVITHNRGTIEAADALYGVTVGRRRGQPGRLAAPADPRQNGRRLATDTRPIAASRAADGARLTARPTSSGVVETRQARLRRAAARPCSAGRSDDETWEEVEEALIAADLGAELAMRVVEKARAGADIADAEAAVQAELLALFAPRDPTPWPRIPAPDVPAVILVVGVNGTGKTTTIAKLAYRFSTRGARVLLAAGDTFRAAAIEQLEHLGAAHRRAGHRPRAPAPIHRPSSTTPWTRPRRAARDVVIVDTAGRLHTKVNLMDELAKIRRTIAKRLPDATAGGALRPRRHDRPERPRPGQGLPRVGRPDRHRADQARLDARGGIAFAIEDALKVPVLFVGVGEKIDDLLDFDPNAFVEALFA